jgi:hypothetical protein
MLKRRLTLLCGLLIALLLIPVFAFAEADGFRNVKWGTDFSTLTDMQYVGTDQSYGGVKKYTKKGDELRIGGATLEGIEYGFWQGKFSSVLIKVKGFANFSALKDATFEKFGSGHKGNRFMERYIWFGEITTMMLDYREVSSVGSLFMNSKEINAQQKIYEQENAKKGAEKGF